MGIGADETDEWGLSSGLWHMHGERGLCQHG